MTHSADNRYDIERDVLDLIKSLAMSLAAGRRVSNDRAILAFVFSLHELVYSYQRHQDTDSAAKIVLKELSRSVSDLLPASLSAISAAIEAERRPFADEDDGDPLTDDFVDGVRVRYRGYDADLAITPTEDAFLVALRCIKGLRVSILAEFQRQGFDASTKPLPIATWS